MTEQANHPADAWELLQQHPDRYRLLVEQVRDYAIFLLDPEGRVASWNAGAERIKGYRADEALGRHLSTFYLPEAVAQGRPAEALERAARDGRHEEEGWRVRKDGSCFWASAVLTALRDEQGRLLGFAKVTRDLTERRRAEEQARQLAREQAARAAAEEGVRARDRFLRLASHELRTPLTPLLINLQLLLRAARGGSLAGPLSGRVVPMLEVCERQVRQFAKIVNELLDVTRIVTGRLELRPEDVDLADLARDVVQRLRPELEQAGCPGLLRAGGPVRGRWDRGRLEQVLTHLLSNAMKYGRGQPVEVRVEAGPSAARLTVADRGPGISPEHQARIFEPFERAVGYEHGGLGLGLYVARQVVQAHGGSLQVTSEPGSGARFTAELPYDPARAGEKDLAGTPLE